MASNGNTFLDLIADAADDDAVGRVLERVGGSRISLPGVPAADHWLSELIGHGAAKAVCAAMCSFGHHGQRVGGMFDVPLAERASAERNRREILRLLKLGRSIDRIAREVGVSRRTVQRWRAWLKKASRTPIPVPSKDEAP
jgi:hypothetical protein